MPDDSQTPHERGPDETGTVDSPAATRVPEGGGPDRGTPDPDRRSGTLERAATFVMLSVSMGVIITCAGPPRSMTPAGSSLEQMESPTDRGPDDVASPASSATPPSASAVVSDEPAPVATPPAASNGPLAAFRKKLSALEAGERTAPVRVLWLGDSHTAADFMSDPVRASLFAKYGSAGPGYARLGLRNYRHSRVRSDVVGKWHRTPQQPSRRSRVSDGVFGLCGIRLVPESGASATLRLDDAFPRRADSTATTPETVRWELQYRLPKGARLRVKLGQQQYVLDENTESVAVEGTTIRRFVVSGAPSDDFTVQHVAGSPEVYGVIIESEQPGVVLDTCGIDGARAETALAWEPAAWEAEVKARRPDLLVLAYGTNEAFDKTAVRRYRAHFTELVERARKADADLACFIVGPPDAATTTGDSLERVLAITDLEREVAAELGCGFASSVDLMGGEGSFARWMDESPPLARRDRVHLTIAGYGTLGESLAAALLEPSTATPSGASTAPPASTASTP